MMDFRSRFAKAKAEKGMLCVGLDPATPRQGMKEAIPAKYLEGRKDNEAKLAFCLDIIDQVKDYASVVKPNQQFVADFTLEQNQELTSYARKAGLLIIKDYKLNDIGNTISSAVYHLANQGYDATTYNPLLGNLEESVKIAHASNLGVIVLALTSNPEANLFLRNALVDGRPLYEAIAKQVKAFDADGCVMGATGHVTSQDINTIVTLAGADKVYLIPGVGAQGGDASRFAGINAMINVGRDIIYNPDPRTQAAYYAKLFASYAKK
jgi:orotidine-5'-phosphate decarboxylase